MLVFQRGQFIQITIINNYISKYPQSNLPKSQSYESLSINQNIMAFKKNKMTKKRKQTTKATKCKETENHLPIQTEYHRDNQQQFFMNTTTKDDLNQLAYPQLNYLNYQIQKTQIEDRFTFTNQLIFQQSKVAIQNYEISSDFFMEQQNQFNKQEESQQVQEYGLIPINQQQAFVDPNIFIGEIKKTVIFEIKVSDFWLKKLEMKYQHK